MIISRDFWKSFGQIGIQSSRKRQIPWEVVTDDNSISVDHNTVLEKWKNDFETLLNCDRDRMQNDVPVMSGNYPVLVDTSTLNTAISAAEVRFALNTAKRGKAMGYDDIPIEVLQSEQCAEYL